MTRVVTIVMERMVRARAVQSPRRDAGGCGLGGHGCGAGGMGAGGGEGGVLMAMRRFYGSATWVVCLPGVEIQGL